MGVIRAKGHSAGFGLGLVMEGHGTQHKKSGRGCGDAGGIRNTAQQWRDGWISSMPVEEGQWMLSVGSGTHGGPGRIGHLEGKSRSHSQQNKPNYNTFTN